MENLFEILPSNFSIALGWTLIHSFWQSVILLAIFQLALFFTKKNAIKYQVGIASISLQVFFSFLTFGYLYEPSVAFSAQNISLNQVLNSGQLVNEVLEKGTFLYTINNWISTNIGIIVTLWIFGLVFYFIRFCYNIWFVNQLKTKDLSKPTSEIIAIFDAIKTKLNMPFELRLMESARVLTPVLIGHFKPIVLLPICLCTNLSSQEIEAIFVHEFAHLKRHDYLINILQSVIDIIYFFNPAIQFISYQIRELRESCCDDFATENCGSSIPIAKALVSIESFRQESKLAMAFGRKSTTLKNRVQKILGITPEKAIDHKGIVFILLLFICSIFYINIQNTFAQKQPKKSVSKNNIKYKNDQQFDVYEENGKRKIVVNDKNGIRLSLVQENGKVIFNGKEYMLSPADSAKIAYHNSEISKLEKEINGRSNTINELSREIEKLSNKINYNSEPLNKKGHELGILGQEIVKLAGNQAKITRQLSKLDDEKDRKLIAELELQETLLEKKIDDLENKMQKLSAEMQSLSDGIDVQSDPIDSLSNLIEMQSAPIEALSNKIEEHAEAIFELYPEDVKAEYRKVMEDVHFPKMPPPPPPPPASKFAPRPPKAPIPPRPPKAPNYNKNTGYHIQNEVVAPVELEANLVAPSPIAPVANIELASPVEVENKIESIAPSPKPEGYAPLKRFKKK